MMTTLSIAPEQIEQAIRAYRACGFVEEGRLRQHVWSDGAYDDLLYMGILRQDRITTLNDVLNAIHSDGPSHPIEEMDEALAKAFMKGDEDGN